MAVPRPPQGLPNAARLSKITTHNSQQSGGGARYQGLIEKTPYNYRVGSDIQPRRDLTHFIKWPKYAYLQHKRNI
eukprot:9068910-Heterocapsa_arctica.AAC.1